MRVPWVVLMAMCTLTGLFGWVLGRALRSPEITALPPHRQRMAHDVKCAELRGEFFEQCRATTTRQDCEALYGQTRGHLFDGPPHLPFVKELDCSGTAHED